jgi:O-antigen/teichoic acid export membrane protein
MARNASFMFGGQGISFLTQAIYFVLLARLLGATEYGVFAGAFALVSIVAPYSALGANMLFMRYVPREARSGPVYWGNSLLITTVLSAVLAGLFAVVGPRYTHIPSPMLFVVLTVANCFLQQIIMIGASVYQTFEKMHVTATLTLISNLARLAVLVAMKVWMRHANALQWSVGMTLGTAVAAAWSVHLVYKEVSGMRFSVRLAVRRMGEGIGYSFAGSTQAVYNDLDKTMLSHYNLSAENGPYTLAYRITDFATSPIAAVDAVIMPRFFQYGAERMGDVMALVRKSMRTAVLMGLGAGVVLLLCAPLTPLLVGKGFGNVVIALRWLCVLPVLRAVHRISGSALTGIGYQNVRTAAQFAVAAVNLGLNVWWIPRYGWIAAAWSSVVADGLLAVLNVVLLFWVRGRVARGELPSPPLAELPDDA